MKKTGTVSQPRDTQLKNFIKQQPSYQPWVAESPMSNLSDISMRVLQARNVNEIGCKRSIITCQRI